MARSFCAYCHLGFTFAAYYRGNPENHFSDLWKNKTQMINSKFIFIPLLLIFILCSGAIYFLRDLLVAKNIDWRIVLGANVVFMLLASISVIIQLRSFRSSNPHAFVRSVMAGMFFKMGGVILAVLSYVLIAGEGFNKRAVFTSLLLYLVYLFTEVFFSVRYLKHRKTNG